MKLLRFGAPETPRVGVVKGDAVIDLAEEGVTSTVMGIVAGGPSSFERIAELVRRAEPRHPLSSLRLLPPIERPLKYLAIGMNYAKHQAEAATLGVEAPKKQFWFNKQTSCLSGPYDDIDPGVS